MTLDSVGIEDFRCIERAELSLHDRCNLISGEIASGKTSLLEAIFVLGRGRSFRTVLLEKAKTLNPDKAIDPAKVWSGVRN